jgi:hypothetical protein
MAIQSKSESLNVIEAQCDEQSPELSYYNQHRKKAVRFNSSIKNGLIYDNFST